MDAKVKRLLNVIATAVIAAVSSVTVVGPFVIGIYLLYKFVWKGKAPYFQIF